MSPASPRGRKGRPPSRALSRLLQRINGAGVFSRRIHLWGSRLRACSADRLLALWLLRLGLLGRAEAAAIRRLAPPGGRAVDVGANQGAFTLLLSRLVGPSGEVVAVEPDPGLFEALGSNCRENGAVNVELHRIAASDRDGHGVLHRSTLNRGDNRLDSDPGPGDDVAIELARLDDVLRGRAVDLVKIDVQGHEPRVLAGLQATLSSGHRPVLLFEFFPDGIRAAGYDPGGFLESLRRLGYVVLSLGPGGEERPLDARALDRLRGPLGYVDLLARPAR